MPARCPKEIPPMTDARPPRIPNLPESQWTPEVQALFPIMLPPGSTARGSDFNSILVLAHHPRLSGPWLRFNAAVSSGFTLTPRLKEIAVLRVAWRSQSSYEWTHHMLSGLRAGLDRGEFAALMEETPGDRWSELERGVILAVDDLWRQQKVGDAAWSILSRHATTEQAVELLYLIGGYFALAGILNTAEAPVEPPILGPARALEWPDRQPLGRAAGAN
jgi:4-carboxymuconolactone decarboxylase